MLGNDRQTNDKEQYKSITEDTRFNVENPPKIGEKKPRALASKISSLYRVRLQCHTAAYKRYIYMS